MNKVFIPLCLSIELFDVLLKAIDFYSHASGVFNYEEEMVDCDTIRHKIMRNLDTEEEYKNYMETKNPLKVKLEEEYNI